MQKVERSISTARRRVVSRSVGMSADASRVARDEEEDSGGKGERLAVGGRQEEGVAMPVDPSLIPHFWYTR
ncbi:hypothetical protein M0804_009623 [Polistes exclamans]|nr:hypothetical protein M0804_009623 [Polistes exclamans]